MELSQKYGLLLTIIAIYDMYLDAAEALALRSVALLAISIWLLEWR